MLNTRHSTPALATSKRLLNAGPALTQLTARLVLAGCVASALAPVAFAAALGGTEVRSALNQPLRVRIAVSLREGEELAPNCVRAVAPQRDDLPGVAGARASLQRDDRGSYVQYVTSAPVTEPAVRGAIEIGCTDPVTREFVVLLDPLPVNAPVLPAASAQAAAPGAAGAAARAAASPQALPAHAARTMRPSRAPVARTGVPANPVLRTRANVAALSDRLTLTPASIGASGLLGGASGLKLSELLARVPQSDSPPADADAARKLAIEQARLAAILRDEDPLAAAQAKERELSDRLTAMNRDLSAVRVQLNELSQRNRELERFAWLKWIVWAAAGLLGLLALFFGLRALREFVASRRRPKEDPWWTGSHSSVMRPPTVYADNPYRDTIKPAPAPPARRRDITEAPSTFETKAPDSAHKIEVQELERASTTFEREFAKPPETQLDGFSTTLPQPTELQRTAQPTRFAPTRPATQFMKARGPFSETMANAPTQAIAPLEFDLKLPELDLDVTPPEPKAGADKAGDEQDQGGKPASPPPGKP